MEGSETAAAPEPAQRVRPWRVRMSGRDPTEPHRAATPLELLFDLCFVVAVAQAATALHHELAEGHLEFGLVGFLVVFFTVWWPWMNFTWFASAYDTDDVQYRLLTFVQIAGVLVVAAGVPRVFDGLDFSICVVGYVIMRTALVAQWLRAAREDPAGRRVALRFAAGVGIVQLLWIVRLWIGPPLGIALILVLGIVELLIPWWAERSGRPTPWHPGHIAERYALFTIIVLGECVLAATTAIQAALVSTGVSAALIAISIGGLLLVFALWWSYFKAPALIERLRELRWQIAWGYGHYVIFAAVAALGAGLQVAADAVTEAGHLPPVTAAMTIAVPAAVYLLAIGVLHRRGRPWHEVVPLGVAALLVLGAGVAADLVGVPGAVLLIGLIVAGVVAWHLVLQARGAASPEAPGG